MRLRGTLGLAVALAFALPASASASEIVYQCAGNTNLCRINPDGSGQQQLTTNGTASDPYENASIDHAGDRMVFIRGFDLYAADGNAQNVVGPIDTEGWAPTQISFDGSKAVDQEDFIGYGFATCTFDTTPSSDPTWGKSSSCPLAGRFPTFTPGGQLVISQLLNGHDVVCLLGNFPDGTCTQEIAVDPNNDLDEAAVSPDGQTLAVVAMASGNTTGPIELFSMSGGGLEKVLTNGPDESPAWSPDGSTIVFSRNGNLYTIPVSSSPGSERLLVQGGDAPSWGGPAGGSGGNGGSGSGGNGAAPNTKLSSPKISRSMRKATFKFSASGSASGFQCALVKLVKHHKGPHYSGCHSPKTYKHLKLGKYEFFVRAFNGSGDDPSPATHKFLI